MAKGKIIKSIVEGAGELVKDSVKQVKEVIDPAKLIDQATGAVKKDEFSKYLKNLGGNLTEDEIETRRKEFEAKKEKEMEEAQKVIRSLLPGHLKPYREKEPSVYDENIRREEMKKAQAEEAKKKEQKESLFVPAGQQKGILGGVKRKPATADFERQKNVKIG